MPINDLPSPTKSSSISDLPPPTASTQATPPPSGDNPFQVANTIEKADAAKQQSSSIGGLLKQGIGMAASHIAGVAKGATLGYADATHAVDPDNRYPLSKQSGQLEGDMAVNTGIGGLLGSATSAMGGIGRIASSAAAYGSKGGLEKPEGSDTPQNRLQSAGSGAIMGGVAQGAGEALNALPAALRVGMRSVVPGSAEKYTDTLESLIKGKTGNYQGSEVPAENIWKAAGDTTNNTDKAIANAALKKISPEIRDLIESKANELTGHGVQNAVIGPSAALAVLKGNLAPLAIAPAAAALTGGGLEAARQLAKPASTLNNPSNMAAIESLLEAIKRK